MSSPFDPVMQEALQHFLEGDLHREEGDIGPLFGHIAMTPFRLQGVPQLIHQFMPVERTDTIFIYVNVDENEMPDMVDGQPPIENVTFTQFLNILRKNLGRWDAKWKLPMDCLNDWPKKRILPLKAVIVMQMSPQVSAECALALTCVVDWAFDERDEECDIRVVTISSPIGHDLLRNIVSQQQDEPCVPLCDLASLCSKDPIVGHDVFTGRSSEQIAKALCHIVEESSEKSRLILSFDDTVDGHVSRLLGDEERPNFRRCHILPYHQPSAIFGVANRAEKGKTVMATVMGQFDHLPLTMSPFQELHLVLGRIDSSTPAWDNISRQVLVYPHWTSKQDRDSQLSWACQPDEVKVKVYCDKYMPSAFVTEGVRHVRLVQGAQLWGYVAAALDLISFGVGSQKTIELFVGDTFLVRDIKNRLTMQGLISSSGLNLSETGVEIFRHVLPKVNYDHRLAMLLALESNGAVRRVKAQFAAILVSLPCCQFIKDGVTDRDLTSAFECCRGSARSLARHGTTWAALGLIKYYCAVSIDPRSKNKLGDIIFFHGEAVNDLIQSIHALIDTFLGARLSVDNDSMAMEVDELNEADKLQFHRDLFRAYMHQTVFFNYRKEENGRRVPEFVSLTSLQPCSFSVRPGMLSLMVEPDRLFAETGYGMLFGVSHRLSRSSGSLTFDDWVTIPAEVVAEWSIETGLTHRDLVSTLVYGKSNSIETEVESVDADMT